MEAIMPRRRLIPERTLTPTERSRRHRLRKRGIEPPPAPGRPKSDLPSLEELIERCFPGCSVPSFPDEPR
jgi:hypothetical protein